MARRAHAWQERFNEQWMPEPMSGCWLWLGHPSNSGYGRILVTHRPRKFLQAHRASFLLHHGWLPTGDIDHACRTPLCVNPDHLRPAARTQNNANRRGKSGARSCFKGVHPCHGRTRSERPWRAMIQESGKTRSLGGFPTEIDAARAYDMAARALFGAFACTNVSLGLLAPDPGWVPPPSAHNRSRTHCIRGHELSGDNVYVTPCNGHRQCRACVRMRRRAA
jgi:hypothetical protein